MNKYLSINKNNLKNIKQNPPLSHILIMICIKIYLLSTFKKIIKNSQNYLHIISHKMSDYYLLVLSENIITLENRQIMKTPINFDINSKVYIAI